MASALGLVSMPDIPTASQQQFARSKWPYLKDPVITGHQGPWILSPSTESFISRATCRDRKYLFGGEGSFSCFCLQG